MANLNETHEHNSEIANRMIENGITMNDSVFTDEELEELYAEEEKQIQIMMPEMLNENEYA